LCGQTKGKAKNKAKAEAAEKKRKKGQTTAAKSAYSDCTKIMRKRAQDMRRQHVLYIYIDIYIYVYIE